MKHTYISSQYDDFEIYKNDYNLYTSINLILYIKISLYFDDRLNDSDENIFLNGGHFKGR